jgi:outer membrane protein insertion porin family
MGQNQAWEGRPVVRVELVPPGVLHPADLARVQVIKVGGALHLHDISQTIDQLFATGEFEDIRAEVETAGSGVAVQFITAPTRYISGVAIKGKVIDPPNRGELASDPRLTRGRVFRAADLQTATDALQKLLASNGLYEAEVKPSTEVDATGQQIFLTLDLRYGKRARYDTPVLHGDTKLSEQTIIRATGWRIRFINRWRQVTERTTRGGLAGIVKRYERDDRLRARVSLDQLEYDPKRKRVVPTLTLDAGPRVEVVAIEAKVSKSVMRRYVPVYQEHTIDNDLLAEGARNLRDYFQSRGYADVSVDFRTTTPENDRERVEFVISQGSRYKLVHVGIKGSKYFDEDTIRERMFLEPASFHLRRGRFSDAFRRKDEENIANLYRANGFRDIKVTSTRLSNYGGKTDHIGVDIRIEEGAQWLVQKLTINGLREEDRSAIDATLASLEGQPFSEVNIAADRDRVLTFYASQGFPAADFKAQWKLSDSPNQVELTYTVEPGKQQFVRGILITGLRGTKRKLIERRITLREGDPLSPVAQADIQKSFYDMGVFSRVDTAIENPNGDTRFKNILYAFEEANRYTVSLGFGAQVGRFGTPSTTNLSSAGGATGFSPQFSINASRLNFLGIGHTVSLRGVYSSLQKRASISYFAPRFQNRAGRSLTVSLLYDNTLDVRTFASRRAEASVQVSQRFSRSTTGLFRIAYRQVSVGNVVIPVLLIPQLLQSVRIGIISGNIARDRRDNATDPHRGSFNTADFGWATRYLGSQRNFGRLLLRNATYYRLTKDLTLARQTQFGLITPFGVREGESSDAAVPLPERFFGGGGDSLRAFPFNQAGPRDTGAPVTPGGPSSQPTGFPLGGNALLFNTVELRFPLLGDNIQGVMFHDVGNVYRSLGDISFRFRQRDNTDFNYGVHAVGFGVRYRTPIGPVRGDLAYGLNPPAYSGFEGTAADLLKCGPSGLATPNCRITSQRVSRIQFFFSIGQTF